LRRQAQDASRIPCKVADGRIKLRERYLHARTLEYGCAGEIANGNRTDGARCVEFGVFILTCEVFEQVE
jgi:hypothetical protein